ncbi:MAG: hypothetical protein ACO1QB_19085 [Verrucomicrobiales bacterium]
MRYLVTAKLKTEASCKLLDRIEDGTLGRGSVAGDEYIHNMTQARVNKNDEVQWVETCFCSTPLAEERPYWEEFFEIIAIKDAHARKNCRDLNGEEPWACCHCDCTAKLEARLADSGESLLLKLQREPILVQE